ncbi:MAG TPA: hypothetical protein VJS92_16270, partial [Candidatus Polarisedimenticolaceae bacterium]|nr:hypothetical protein [Candidatus Polarisedimenticolaceae bacterium]
MPVLRLGTRGSRLALWQARHVAGLLAARHPGLAIEERIITTAGDRPASQPLGAATPPGLFVRQIEQALLDETIDLAVHSLKDLTTDERPGLALGAVPERHDPRDAVLSLRGFTLEQLPAGARVGTGSP